MGCVHGADQLATVVHGIGSCCASSNALPIRENYATLPAIAASSSMRALPKQASIRSSRSR